MSRQSAIQIFTIFLLISILGYGNFSCNQDNKSDEHHFCLVQTPSGREVWFKGADHNILWVDDQSDFVRIELLYETLPVLTIADSITNTGIYFWDIPGELDQGIQYRIEISSLNNKSIAGQSMKDFTIRDPFPTSSLIDPRDGQSYKTLMIGDRWWMAENLNYKTESGSFFYENDSVYGNKFGRLYLWNTAMIACPDGWKIPSDNDWKALELAMGVPENEIDKTGMRSKEVGYQLSEKGGSGFDALYAGYYRAYRIPHEFGHVHYDTRFWASDRELGQTTRAWRRALIIGKNGIDRNTTWSTNGYSVRCIKSELN